MWSELYCNNCTHHQVPLCKYNNDNYNYCRKLVLTHFIFNQISYVILKYDMVLLLTNL